jgi:ABC-2 type transport system permease protein
MNRTNVLQAFIRETRALLEVARKEWIIFLRYPSWIMAMVIWPLLFPLGYIFTARALSGPNGVGLATFSALTGTRDVVAYIVFGATFYMWLNITLWNVGGHLRNEQMLGTLESNWLCPVGRLTLLVGANLEKLISSLGFLAVTVLEFRLFFGISLVDGNRWLLLLVVALVIPSIYGIGMVFASLVIRFKESNALVFLVRGTFMVFCGITVPVQILPHWMQLVATFLPLTYAIHASRAAVLTDASFGSVATDLWRLAAFALVLPTFGAYAFRVVERRARRLGTLGQF